MNERCSRSCNSNASLHASSTLDGQGYLRDKDVLVPWPIQIDNARTKCYSLYSLFILIHLRVWIPAQLPVVVPLNDFRPTRPYRMINLLTYPHAAISAVTSKKLGLHLHV